MVSIYGKFYQIRYLTSIFYLIYVNIFDCVTRDLSCSIILCSTLFKCTASTFEGFLALDLKYGFEVLCKFEFLVSRV